MHRKEFKKTVIVIRADFKNPSVLREETKCKQDIDPDNIIVIIKQVSIQPSFHRR
jgi:hypothetical protein